VLALGSFAVTGSASAAGTSVTPGGTISSPNSVDRTTWPTKEDCASEWHWVITGLDGSGIGSSDVPSVVTVTWSDNSTTNVAFDNISGSVAHYYERSVNLVQPYLTVKSATAVWPNPTDVDAYGNFNLSHGPCTVEETTTTVEETTTTVEETTTTVEETTTTVEETTTTVEETTTTVEETTTTVEETTTTAEETTTTLEDTTTTAEETTTTVVEETTTSVESEVPTTSGSSQPTTTEEVASQSPGGELPATGSNASSLMLVGGLVLLAGGALAMALGRRAYQA
jgi:LPXTG-motif cell wall-anchored protein